MSSGKRRRRRVYVHPVQKKYAQWVGSALFLYSVLIFSAVIFAPLLRSAFRFTAEEDESARWAAANEFLAHLDLVIPASVVLIIAAAVFSVFVTHRLAGPLYRLSKVAEAVRRGNLAVRIRLREKDELKELADLWNAALESTCDTVSEAREQATRVREEVSAALDALRAQPGAPPGAVERVEAALAAADQICERLAHFEVSEHPSDG